MEHILDADSILMHVVIRQEDLDRLSNSRMDLVSESNFIQLAIMNFDSDVSFRPHIHLERTRKFSNLRAQESWVVIKGSVEVTYYDENEKELGKKLLSQGDCSVTLLGGHAYRIVQGPALVYEFKTGPYEGQEIDKRFI